MTIKFNHEEAVKIGDALRFSLCELPQEEMAKQMHHLITQRKPTTPAYREAVRNAEDLPHRCQRMACQSIIDALREMRKTVQDDMKFEYNDNPKDRALMLLHHAALFDRLLSVFTAIRVGGYFEHESNDKDHTVEWLENRAQRLDDTIEDFLQVFDGKIADIGSIQKVLIKEYESQHSDDVGANMRRIERALRYDADQIAYAKWQYYPTEYATKRRKIIAALDKDGGTNVA